MCLCNNDCNVHFLSVCVTVHSSAHDDSNGCRIQPLAVASDCNIGSDQ